MKKIFTMMAAATVGLTAFAGSPRVNVSELSELSAYGKHKLMATTAMLANDRAAGIERPGTIKRSYQQGNITYDLVLLVGGEIGDYFTKSSNGEPYTLEEVPMYGVECVLFGDNANGQTVTQIPMLLLYPARYWEQMLTWEGPWQEYQTNTGETVYDIPADQRDLSIVPLTEFVANDRLNAQWQATGSSNAEGNITGYIEPFMTPDPDASKHTYERYVCYPLFNFSGAMYNGQDISLYSNVDMETNPNGTTPVVKLNSYNPTGDVLDAKLDMVARTTSSSTPNVNFLVNYNGEGYVQGFEAKEINEELSQMVIYNAGELSDEAMGDSYPFPDYYEEPLQLYFMLACNSEAEIGQTESMLAAIEKDPTFDRDNVAFFRAKDGDVSKMTFMYGYLFSNLNAGIEKNTWELKRAETLTYIVGGKEYTMLDFITPEPNIFVTREQADEKSWSVWALEYGMTTVFANAYVNYPVKEGAAKFVSNCPEGFVYKYDDQYGNHHTYTCKNVFFCDNYNDMLQLNQIVATGDNDASVKAVAAAPAAVKVSAKNGRINVAANADTDVQIFSINGGLLKSAAVKAGNNLSVEAAKGLYIVKAGKQAVKVVL